MVVPQVPMNVSFSSANQVNSYSIVNDMDNGAWNDAITPISEKAKHDA